jgi:hypothetical protein
MGALKAVGIDEIIKRGSIKDVDVKSLRAAFYEDGIIGLDEAQMLFAVNRASPVQDPSWTPFFIEAITDFIVNQAQPEGYLTLENAAWLISRCSRDGRVESRAEFDLIVHVLERARWSPASLIGFALEQVRFAVVQGHGPLRATGVTLINQISAEDIDMTRRIIFAFGGDGNVGVTRAEAETLFAINDAVETGGPNAAWTDFFVKAIANAVMAASGYAMPSREDALKEDAWLETRGDLTPAAFAKKIAHSGLMGIWDLYKEQSAEERSLARLERQRIEIITNEEITEGEASWLAERLGADGRISDNERALLDYLHRESGAVHPVLKDLAARLSKAA